MKSGKSNAPGSTLCPPRGEGAGVGVHGFGSLFGTPTPALPRKRGRERTADAARSHLITLQEAPATRMEKMPERHITSDPYPWPYNGDLRPDNTALIIIDMQT